MKRFLKWTSLVLLILLLLAGGTVGVLYHVASKEGASPVETWISGQLQSIANSYLNPKLTFDDLDFQAPGTVKLKNLRLTADDPRTPGKTIDILGAADATVVLAEMPKVGKPIVIQQITLNQPLFQAIAMEPGGKEFAGFSGLVKQGVVKDAAKPKSDTRTKLSQVFQMRLVELVDGKIVYDPRLEGTEPMVLDKINTRLDVTPGEDGAYMLKVALKRNPVFDFDIGMKLNLDTLYASEVKINLAASLSVANHSHLPPQIQKVLADHDVKGEMSVRVRGELPLTDYQKGDVLVTAKLTDANVKAGEYRLPIEQLDFQTKLTDGKVLLPMLRVQALQGTLTLGGEVTLNPALDSEMALQVADMQLEELFVNPENADDPKLAGKLTVGVNTKVSLAAVLAKVSKPQPAAPPVLASTTPPPPLPAKWGEGTLKLENGRLVKIPVLAELTQLMAGGKKTLAKTETANAKFTFGDDKLKLSEFNYVGDLIAARGVGTISLDQQLDLLVNGGPIEKVQSLLGKDVGGAFGKFTDQLLSYRVRGTLSEPKPVPQVGGDMANKVGGGAVDTAKEVGKGAENIFKGLIGK